MTPVLTSLIAVAGTLLGVILGGIFQRRSADRSERRKAGLAYADAITDVILNQQDRWHRNNEEPDGPEAQAARRESHRLRKDARRALNGVAMHIPVAAVLDQAEATFSTASDVHHAVSEADLTARSGAARRSVRAFITLASRHIR